MEMIDIPSSSVHHLLHPKMTVLVTSEDENGKTNIITVAWAMPTSSDPPLLAISVGKQKYSNNLIRDSGEFVVNVPEKSLLDEVKFCGSRSGSSVDKFKESGLTRRKSKKLDTPGIDECPVSLECSLFKEFETGDHTIFVGKVEANSVDEEIFDEVSGNLDMDEFNPIFHVGGSEFVTSGESL